MDSEIKQMCQQKLTTVMLGAPEVLEPIRRQLSVPARMLDVAAAAPCLEAPRIASGVRRGEAARRIHHDGICRARPRRFLQRHHSNRGHRPDGVAHRGRRPVGNVRRDSTRGQARCRGQRGLCEPHHHTIARHEARADSQGQFWCATNKDYVSVHTAGIALHNSTEIDSTIQSTRHSLPEPGPSERLHSRIRANGQAEAEWQGCDLPNHDEIVWVR
jgi:hypothetical protein